MGDGFRVDPEAITRYASTTSDQYQELDWIQSSVADITISSSAFGHLPNAQNLAQTYQTYAQAARKNLADLSQALQSTGQGLNATAQNYEEHERETGASFGGGQ